MKCPECEVNHRYKLGMKCSCGYQFVFNPKSDQLTDGKFIALINRVSQQGTRYFTQPQLYAAYVRDKGTKTVLWGCAAIIPILVLIGMSWNESVPFLCCVGIFVVGVLLGNLFSGNPKSPARFDEFVERWKSSPMGDTFEKMLEESSLTETPPEWNEADLHDYGVERLLIVEHDLLVDLLVKNNVHTTERALIMSLDGYPHYLQDRARQVVAERPDLPIYLLHDYRKNESNAFANRVTNASWIDLRDRHLIDLGLNEADIANMKAFKYRTFKNANHIPVDWLSSAALATGLAGCLARNDENLATALNEQPATTTMSDGVLLSDGLGGFG